MKPDFVTSLTAYWSGWAPVGSKVTCNPPPADGDVDYLMLASDGQYINLADGLRRLGFTTGSSSIYADQYPDAPQYFQSWRRGEENVLTTSDPDFYRRFVAGTDVARRLNLQSKEDRIALFQAVLYGNGDADR